MKRKKCRGHIVRLNSHITHSLKTFEKLSKLPILGFLLLYVAALTYGCTPYDCCSPSKDTKVKLLMKSSSAAVRENSVYNSLDIFTFNDDILKRIDSYVRYDMPAGNLCEVASRTGPKIVGIIANSHMGRYDWGSVNSLESFCDIRTDLEKEERAFPSMSGFIAVDESSERIKEVRIEPICSKVTLRSIRCDFKGKPYEDEMIENVKVYLTNVSARCRFMSEGYDLPERIINIGGLSEYDVGQFREPDIIFKTIPLPIGKNTVYPGISLLCYPNSGKDETPGTPFTRLVIEGELDGNIWYWPININRDDGGNGIGRNRTYIYDITITCKGSTNPDTVIDSEQLKLKTSVKEWLEQEAYGVQF